MSIVPLHVRSGYSLGRGAATPGRLVARAVELGHEAMALTDVNGLCGSTVFHRCAEEAGLRPIIGAELLDERGGCVSALVIDRKGYENLCQVVTAAHANDYERVCEPFDVARDLPRYSDGLHVFTENAALVEALLAGGVEPGRLWLELDPASQSRVVIGRLVEAAGRLGVGLLATGRAMMVDAEDLNTVRLLTAIRLGATWDRIRSDQLPPAAAVLRGPDELRSQLADFPPAVANNRRVAEQCVYRLLPQPAVFPDYTCPPGQSAARHLRELCDQGVRWRYGEMTDPIRHRLGRELKLIERMGFAEYFLVVRDIVQYARSRRAPIAGRGSGAGSLVAYVLGITNVCPLTFDLPFERFLHEYREDFPDLDIDFCWRIRDDVIDYAFRRWGADRVAMVSTHNMFQSRSAFREAAKAFGLSEDQVSHVVRHGQADDESLAPVARLAGRIVGLPHLLSVHPGGIVIGRKPIDHYVPVQPALKGVRISQLDKDGVEDIGLVKLDLLGNRALSTIRGACDLVADSGGGELDIETLPPDDPMTIEMLRRGDTVGVNQLESPAMRHLLLNMRPRGIRDVMNILALIRPGAANIGMKETFIRRHRGLELAPAGDSRIAPILRDNHGVMLYEDDVMFVAAAMLGGSVIEGDRFRRAVQKCRDDNERRRLSELFLGRCRANGVDDDYARDMWVQMAKYNAYSFCRAHAASYARLAYAVAYLKAHHPLEFWAAALNNNQSMYHPRVYVEQAKRTGIEFLGPDVNGSAAEYEIQAGRIRVGLNRIDGLGPVSIDAIIEARRDRLYTSLSDCMERSRIGKEEAESLALCGAMDSLGPTRPALILELNLWRPSRTASRRGSTMLLEARPTVPDVLDDYSEHRKYWDQRRILGISIGPHPLSLWRSLLAGKTDADSRDLRRRVGRRVRIAGLMEAYRSAATQNGRKVSFFTFDDEYGLFETQAFFESCRLVGKPAGDTTPALVTGRVEDRHDAIVLLAERIEWQQGDKPPET